MSNQPPNPKSPQFVVGTLPHRQRSLARQALSLMTEPGDTLEHREMTINGQPTQDLASNTAAWTQAFKRTRENIDIVDSSAQVLDAETKMLNSTEKTIDSLTSNLSKARQAIMISGTQKSQDVRDQTIQSLKAFLESDEELYLVINTHMSSKYNHKLDVTEQHISEVEQKIEEVRNSDQANEKATKDAAASLKSLRSEKSLLQSSLSQLQRERKTADTMLASLEKANTDLTSVNSELTSEKAEFVAKLNSLEQAQKDLAKGSRQLSRSNTSLKEENSSLQDQIASLTAHLNKLSVDLTSVINGRLEMDPEICEIPSSSDNLDDALRKSEQLLDWFETAFKFADEDTSEANKKVTQLQEEAQQKDSKIDQLTSDIQTLIESVKDRASEIVQQATSIQGFEESIQGLEEQMKQLDAENSVLKRDVTNHEAALEQKATEIVNLDADLQTSRQSEVKFRASYDQACQEMTSVSARLNAATQRILDLQAVIDDSRRQLQVETDSKRKYKDMLRCEHERLKEQRTLAETEKAKKHVAESQVGSMVLRLRDALRATTALQIVHDQLRTDYDRLNAHAADQEQVVQSSKQVVDALRKQVMTIDLDRHALQIAQQEMSTEWHQSQSSLQQSLSNASKLAITITDRDEMISNLQAAIDDSRTESVEQRQRHCAQEAALESSLSSLRTHNDMVEAQLKEALHHAEIQNSVCSNLETQVTEIAEQNSILTGTVEARERVLTELNESHTRTQDSLATSERRLDGALQFMLDSLGLDVNDQLDSTRMLQSYMNACGISGAVAEVNGIPVYVHGLGQISPGLPVREQCQALLAQTHSSSYRLSLDDIVTLMDSFGTADVPTRRFVVRSVLTILQTVAQKYQQHSLARSIIVLHCMHLLCCSMTSNVSALLPLWQEFDPYWHAQSRLVSGLVKTMDITIRGAPSSLKTLLDQQPSMKADDYSMFEELGGLVVFNTRNVAYVRPSAYQLHVDALFGWQIQFTDAPLVKTWSTRYWDIVDQFEAPSLYFPNAVQRANGEAGDESYLAYLDCVDV